LTARKTVADDRAVRTNEPLQSVRKLPRAARSGRQRNWRSSSAPTQKDCNFLARLGNSCYIFHSSDCAAGRWPL
jgi:hypothetical protein